MSCFSYGFNTLKKKKREVVAVVEGALFSVEVLGEPFLQTFLVFIHGVLVT